MELLNYLMGLAQEGETLLVVRQKPQNIGGKPQYHADGAMKCTWPAQLPSKRMKDGGAYYANTGSFILDRMAEGVSASARNCEYVLCMVLDDIGTKSKTPPLPPTWITETSPNNYQWGYVFSEQPNKGDFSAAIKAIAEAGYTDPGAINPVRNFRLPGSVNLKPGKDGYITVLTELHQDREYTLAEIVSAFGVVPAPADAPRRYSVALSDDGKDDVLAWLNDQGLVLEATNRAGWAGVVCPNSAEHSDGNPMGRYSPSNRAYCCYHGHCADVDSAAFLAWVEEQGGPSHQAGMRDDLLASVMNEVYETIENKPGMFSDLTTAEAAIKRVEEKQLARLTKDQLHGEYAYVESDDSYFSISLRADKDRKVFNALYAHLDTLSVHGAKPSRVSASVWFDQMRFSKNGKVLSGITYAPGEDALVARDGLIYGNKWVDSRMEGIPGDVTPWLRLFERVVPDAAERSHIMDVMAFKRQNPAVKINHAVLIIGKPGIGKDSVYAPFLASIGSHNTTTLRNEEIGGQWGYQYEREVVVLNELYQAESRDRRALENALKPIIAAPPEYLSVNRKGLHPYEAVNRLLLLAGSNRDVPITLPSDDRRWFVVKSHAEPLKPEEGKALWAWFKSIGFAAVTAWLDARDVAAFNPGAAPPFTEAKQVMIEQGYSSGESFLLELIRERRGEFACGAIAAPWQALCERVQVSAPSGTRIYPAALFLALAEARWIDAGRLLSRDYPTKKHIYHAPELIGESRSDLRRLVEPGRAPGLAVVR